MIKSIKIESHEKLIEIRPGRKINIFTMIDKNIDLTIFFYHGSMATLKQFSSIISLIKEKLPANIIAYDALGCGKSERPNNYSAYSTEELLLDAIEVFKLFSTNKSILIGHSFGTSILAKLCYNFDLQNSISGLILLGTAWKVPDGGHPIFALPEFILECIRPQLNYEFSKLAYSPETSEESKILFNSLKPENDMHVVRSFYQQLKWATESEWCSIKNFPVLIIQGKDDNITTMENALKLYEEIFNSNDRNINCVRSSFKSLEAAGHMLMLEKSNIVSDYIVEFVKEKISLHKF